MGTIEKMHMYLSIRAVGWEFIAVYATKKLLKDAEKKEGEPYHKEGIIHARVCAHVCRKGNQMIELTNAVNDEVIYLNPNSIAAIERLTNKNVTQVMLSIQGPKDMGPISYHVKESPEVVWQKYAQHQNTKHDKIMRDMNDIMKSAHS